MLSVYNFIFFLKHNYRPDCFQVSWLFLAAPYISLPHTHTKNNKKYHFYWGILKLRFWCLGKSGGTLFLCPCKADKKFLLGGILHNIAIKHGLSLVKEADSHKSNRDEELSESEEIHLQMSNWNYY